ncbi:hypothetical protein JZK55_19550 [Dissulfurispira thermophila]|uniref:Uncharacterized protein n=1 Tax=Dissulfurispira thermophila TaxID=2715679 RepID=A0A7G1H4H9_9BACT|nr:hypothetical protein [Dissulfurispira thermophila]BCB97033.1 hypothetical protein JZK55_19550 [Dissulfurispira thermophila]
MVINPAIVALLLSSLIISSMLCYAAFFAIEVIKKWNITSGSEVQINLERKTYLISTIVSYAFAFEVMSFFLFIYTSDDLHNMFVGAMCAAGTLNVNPYGYPTLIFKIINFMLAGVWLIMNYTDNRGYDYPLIKKKYAFILFITPLVLVETVLQSIYFLSMRAEVITSCCGALFGVQREGLLSSMASVPPVYAMAVFYGLNFLTIAQGIYTQLKDRGFYLFSLMSVLFFIVSVISLISFISPYFYQLPTHNCPFCILQKEYNYIGYPLYISLFIGTMAAIGASIIAPYRKSESLKDIIPLIKKRLIATTLLCYIIFTGIASYPIIFSDFRLSLP